MTKTNHEFDRAEVDEQFVDVLLQREFARVGQTGHVSKLVDGVMSRIEASHEDPSCEVVPERRRWMVRTLNYVAAAAAMLVAVVGIGWVFFGSAQSAQAAVIDVIEKTLAGGPRKYDAKITYYGALRGKFERNGAFYVDGHKTFAFKIPSPLGLPVDWHFGSDGEKLWAVTPTGIIWEDEGERLENWWETRGFEDAPILHIEAILDTLSKSYDLESLPEKDGQQRILGVANDVTPKRWAEKIELAIDNESGFARTMILDWESGRIRRVVMNWDETAIVPPSVFESNNTNR